jgi:hypothetical protein
MLAKKPAISCMGSGAECSNVQVISCTLSANGEHLGEHPGLAGEGRSVSAESGAHSRAEDAGFQAAALRLRRAKPRRAPLAKIRPGSPAPTMGPGTGTPGVTLPKVTSSNTT